MSQITDLLKTASQTRGKTRDPRRLPRLRQRRPGPLPAWEDAYLWPCAHGGLTVCADCFDTLVGGLSRRELAQRLSAEVQP